MICLGLSLWLAILEPFTIIGPGSISLASPGVLEAVAQRRIAYGWGLSSIPEDTILVAPADCNLLGRRGWLVAGGEVLKALVVDCQADVHEGEMEGRGLLLDVNGPEGLDHKDGWLILQ